MGAIGDVARDFVEVELHHVSVGVGQHEGRPDAEETGVVAALVGGLLWPRSAPAQCRTWPLFWPMRSLIPCSSRDVFKPNFDRGRLRQAVDMSLQRAREVLWNGPPLLPAT